MVNVCQIQWLGRMPYGTALKLQKELVARRASGEIPNTLLLVEHDPTYTVGIDSHPEHLLISRDELARLNIDYYQADRGGPVLYHGPGQLVCYPIINLREYGYGYHEYIKMLERVIIHTLALFKVRAFRARGQSGVWVFADSPIANAGWSQPDYVPAQIATIGVKLNEQHITSHGLAINVNPNLEFFNWIIPADLQSCKVTSLSRVLNEPVKIGSVCEPVIQSFCQVFEVEPLTLETRVEEVAISV